MLKSILNFNGYIEEYFMFNTTFLKSLVLIMMDKLLFFTIFDNDIKE